MKRHTVRVYLNTSYNNSWCFLLYGYHNILVYYVYIKLFDVPFEKVISCMIYSLKYECGLEIPLKLICGIDVAGMQNNIVLLHLCKINMSYFVI